MTLRAALSSADAKAPYVRRLFHTIADRYDLITGLLSFGRDRRWKATLVALADVRPGARALDLAAGTGDIAFGLAAKGARVAALDITHRMLQIASAKRPAPATVAFVTGDMMALPFHDETFDLVTTGYGVRNVPAIEPAIAEIGRVLRPGGLLLSLDFDRPAHPLVRGIYLGYLTVAGSILGWVLHRDPDTYRYIPESIRRYPGAAGVAALLARAGFDDSRVIPLLGGLMAINVARREIGGRVS
jgi:demethylmenaquinone methyltransferase/2-methoxy-6-polyprenyl-1,4-benzoquinol methylase